MFAALDAGLIWLYRKPSSLIRFAPLFAYILGHNYRSVGTIKRAAETLYGRRSNDADDDLYRLCNFAICRVE